jgi:hypothetical protein
MTARFRVMAVVTDPDGESIFVGVTSESGWSAMSDVINKLAKVTGLPLDSALLQRYTIRAMTVVRM